MLLAVQIEKNYSKEQILEMYLNEVCYGVNTFGVKAAAKPISASSQSPDSVRGRASRGPAAAARASGAVWS
jgi:hypothetical protein